MKPLETAGREDALLLTVPEAARALRIGQSLCWDLVRSGTLPVVRLGRAVRVPRRHLEALAANAHADSVEARAGA